MSLNLDLLRATKCAPKPSLLKTLDSLSTTTIYATFMRHCVVT